MIDDKPTIYQYSGDGSTKTFPFPSSVIDASNIRVSVRASDGSVTDLVYGNDYSVNVISITSDYLPTAEVVISASRSAPAAGSTVIVSRRTEVNQDTKFDNQGPYFAKATEEAFDKIIMILQELGNNSGQAAIDDLYLKITQEATARANSDASLQNGISAETTARQSADAAETLARTQADSSEAAARQAGDTALQNNINTEATDRATNDAALDGRIDAESAARQATDTALQNNIDAEAAVRATYDAALDQRIDDMDARIDDLNAVGKEYVDTELAKKADKADTYSKSEVNSRMGEKADSTALNAETAARENADAALGQRIDTEITDRQAADSAETVARIAADTALGSRIDTEVSDRQTAIENEITARGSADAALGRRIDNISVNGEADAKLDAEIAERIAADVVLQEEIAGKMPLAPDDGNLYVASGDTWIELLFETGDPFVTDADNVAVTVARPAYLVNLIWDIRDTVLVLSEASVPGDSDSMFVVDADGVAVLR